MDGALDAADYDQLRIVLAAVSVVVDGRETQLSLPLDVGVPIDTRFSIDAGQHYEMVLDFDALDSVVRTPLGYQLQPDITVESFEPVKGGDTGR